MTVEAAITKLGKLSKLTSSREACDMGITALRFWSLPWYRRVIRAIRGRG
jgi:hypothetical protein